MVMVVSSWKVPDIGCAKLNTDSSFISENGSTGSGMILRDHVRDILFSSCRCLVHRVDALKAERSRYGFVVREIKSPMALWNTCFTCV